MKKLIILFFILTLTSIVFAQDCPMVKSELAGWSTHGTNVSGGIWTGRYTFFETEKNEIPPHCELHLGNIFIGNSKETRDLITVYGFNKDKYTNFVKLHTWEGYDVKIEESFGRIWVIIYNKKQNNSENHLMCSKMSQFIADRCHGNPNF